MSEQKQERPRRGYVPVFGLILIFLGVVFLLQSIGVIPWGLWHILWRFWPILIIIAGIAILLRCFGPWLTSILILVLLFACLGIAIWQYNTLPLQQLYPATYSQSSDNLEHAKIKLDFVAGKLKVGNLTTDSVNLVEVSSKATYGEGAVKTDFQRTGNEGNLHLSGEGNANTGWEMKLNRKVPLTVVVNSAITDAELNLSELNVTDFRMNADVGNFKVIMPASHKTTAYIKAAVVNMEVIIPQGVAARLKTKVDLGILEVDQNRFQKQEDFYMSRDFGLAQNPLEIQIDCGLGRVQVK